MAFYLAWYCGHVPAMVAMTSAYYFLLVPVETTRQLALIEYERITHVGRPSGTLYISQLQLLSPRDPDLTVSGPPPIECPRERALLRRLQERATAASYVLPEIVPTGAAPGWARGMITARDRSTLWRAGGA